MSVQKNATLSSSDAYKKRYAEYQQVYCETSLAMTPPAPEPAPIIDPNNPNPDKGAINRGVQKTALKRKVRYNKPVTRQSANPTS